MWRDAIASQIRIGENKDKVVVSVVVNDLTDLK